ncbi:nuclear transport factor 2 family protein [Flavobacterium salilacus subsp. salilacus]|uniref:nuclear transport factor 2 family protein n=1 Tax=Flavobacterium TaxID=237 RepID=UPI001075872A|nr:MULTISPECIES: nuclear transport factor 2 family protein [Flavobacterium]KAF2518763.1 nuclear transport factor 2 family protein [Flavobacterium salilacus subsp. salilacus]MBE1613731.1 nuclear transport factor 2 family protein [Flavobacterium sp. SaA2.13]
MKRVILLSVLFITTLLSAQESDVKKAIITFFEGMHTADTLKMKSVCAEGLLLQSVAEAKTGNSLTTDTAQEFYKSIATIPSHIRIEERLLSYDIQIDGAMAHAWTPYEFYINDRLSHGGVNSFTLFNDNGTWKIIYIIDTRHKSNPD